MDENVKKQLKKSFGNVQFCVITILTIVSCIGYFMADIEILKDVFVLGVFLIAIFVYGFFKGLKMEKNIENVKNGKLKYEPYILNKEAFVKECENGLMYSLIRINNEIYEIETQLDEVESKNYDKFTCFINENEIQGLENFFNFKFDNGTCLKDMNEIEFLEYNNNDPKEYFVNGVI